MSDGKYPIATRLVKSYAEEAIELIMEKYDYSAIEESLKRACRTNKHDFYKVMSLGEDRAPSQAPHRPISPPPSSVASSPLSKQHSSPDIDGFIHALDFDDNRTKISMKRNCQSHSLIRANIVSERLQLEPCVLEKSIHIPYNDGQILVSQYVTVTYMQRGSRATEEVTCFLCSVIDVDMIIGDWKAALDRQPQQLSHGVVKPRSQKGQGQGLQFEEYSLAQSFANTNMKGDPTTTSSSGTITQLNNMVGQQTSRAGLEKRRTSTARHSASSSHIPRLSSSPTSSASSAAIDSSRKSSQSVIGPSSHTPHPNQSAQSMKTMRVLFMMGGSQVKADLDLHANGEIFFLTLTGYLSKVKVTLDRDVHSVCFIAEKPDGPSPSCLVDLSETKVIEDWQDAVPWITSNKENSTRFYATIS